MCGVCSVHQQLSLRIVFVCVLLCLERVFFVCFFTRCAPQVLEHDQQLVAEFTRGAQQVSFYLRSLIDDGEGEFTYMYTSMFHLPLCLQRPTFFPVFIFFFCIFQSTLLVPSFNVLTFLQRVFSFCFIPGTSTYYIMWPLLDP